MSKNMIANRYEVFQHVGQGGMADVFLAVDTILNRQVAIKILRAELSTDAVSVLRFEREAQSATALTHQNIVEIYDVGDYKGHHYIVMEYVPGKTLKQVIKNRGALLKEEAVDITKQLCSAIAEAHKRGIIHRDIKPQNIIVKSDGIVKVLDFGIAMAKGSMQLTQANNVMGSVHYLAPELARGESASVQSDVYALGIVLFEMLTGDVPFKAEGAVQVALMQMRNELPELRYINPQIPQSIENIVMKATAKDKTLRYRNCNEMLEDLRTCLKPERLNEPKRRLVSRPPKTDEISGTSLQAESKVSSDIQKSSKQVQKVSSAVKNGTRVVAPAVEKKSTGYTFLISVLVVLILILLSGISYVAMKRFGFFEPKITTVQVPDLTGKTLAEAKQISSDLELVLDVNHVTYTLTENVEKGKIIEVKPGIGEEVDKGTSITVTVSSGIAETVDNFVGQNLAQAKTTLADLEKYKLTKLSISEEPSDTAKAGEIIRQELMLAGTVFNPAVASEIRLVYAAYPTIMIPKNIEGRNIDQVIAELEALGVTVTTSKIDTQNLTEEEKANLKTGIVIKSDPAAGSEFTQKEDNFITLYYHY